MNSKKNNSQKYQVLKEVYMLSGKIIVYLSSYLDNLSDDQELTKSDRKDMLEMFLKVGALLCKIIALEHKMGGGYIVDQAEQEDEDHSPVSEEDIQILKSYLERYETKKIVIV